jgi:hypothetical protein
LNQIGIHPDLSKIISKLSTVNGILVQGFNTSPIISNIVATQLDVSLREYSIKNSIKYTRYADDISLSSQNDFPDESEITSIIEAHNFLLNHDKTRKSIRGNYQAVTGLTIFDNERARIPKKIKKNLRLEVYYISKYGMKNHAIRALVREGLYDNKKDNEEILRSKIFETRYRILGWIRFISGIEPKFSNYLNEKFKSRHERNSL